MLDLDRTHTSHLQSIYMISPRHTLDLYKTYAGPPLLPLPHLSWSSTELQLGRCWTYAEPLQDLRWVLPGPTLNLWWTSTGLDCTFYVASIYALRGLVLDLYWTSTGPRLDIGWISTGSLMGPPLDLEWASIGSGLHLYWSPTPSSTGLPRGFYQISR